ncbi:MAG: uroporphyrinogen decarboxylase family protein [Limnochordia bacterium]
MNGKERIAAIFAHQPTDRVPIYMGSMSSRIASKVLGRTAYVGGGFMKWREAVALWDGEAAHREFLEQAKQDALDLAAALDLDYVRPAYWRDATKPTRKIDDYTFLFGDPEKKWYVMRFDPRTELYNEIDRSVDPEPTEADLERYVAYVERSAALAHPTPASFFNLENAIAVFGETKAIHGGGIGISIPWYQTYGGQIWLEMAILRPDLVGRILDAKVKTAVKNIKVQAQMGIRYLHGGGDFAGKHGPMYSPQVFHDLMLPRLQQVSAACKEHGCYHLFASDGDLWPVADDLFGKSGVEGFYEIDKDCGMDLRRLRQRFRHLTLLGGISSARLHRGTRQDVEDEVMSALTVAKEEGSILVGCSNMVVPETPYENFMYMMELLHKHR